jgi:hypothetical protein
MTSPRSRMELSLTLGRRSDAVAPIPSSRSVGRRARVRPRARRAQGTTEAPDGSGSTTVAFLSAAPTCTTCPRTRTDRMARPRGSRLRRFCNGTRFRYVFFHRTTPRGKRPPSARSTVARARRVARSPTSGHPAGTGSGYSMSKAIGSSRRARRGAGCWLRATMAPPAGADIEQPDCVAAGVSGPSSSHRARVHGWASRWGRVRSATLRTIRRRSTRAPVCTRFRPRLRSSARARTAHSRVVEAVAQIAPKRLPPQRRDRYAGIGPDWWPRPTRATGRRPFEHCCPTTD